MLSTSLAFPGWSHPFWSSVSVCGKWLLSTTHIWFAARVEANFLRTGPDFLSKDCGVCWQQVPMQCLLADWHSLGALWNWEGLGYCRHPGSL